MGGHPVDGRAVVGGGGRRRAARAPDDPAGPADATRRDRSRLTPAAAPPRARASRRTRAAAGAAPTAPAPGGRRRARFVRFSTTTPPAPSSASCAGKASPAGLVDAERVDADRPHAGGDELPRGLRVEVRVVLVAHGAPEPVPAGVQDEHPARSGVRREPLPPDRLARAEVAQVDDHRRSDEQVQRQLRRRSRRPRRRGTARRRACRCASRGGRAARGSRPARATAPGSAAPPGRPGRRASGRRAGATGRRPRTGQCE